MKTKTFDAVAFMRQRREEIDLEDSGLTWAEKRDKTRRIIETDPLYRRLKHRLIQPGIPGSFSSGKEGEQAPIPD